MGTRRGVVVDRRAAGRQISITAVLVVLYLVLLVTVGEDQKIFVHSFGLVALILVVVGFFRSREDMHELDDISEKLEDDSVWDIPPRDN